MAVSEANSSLLGVGLRTGETKGERGLAVPSHLPPVAVPVPGQPQHPRAPTGLSEGQADTSTLVWHPQQHRPQGQQMALNFLPTLGGKGFIYSLKVQGGVLELSWL